MSQEPAMILVSACLLGVACRYDGRSSPEPGLRDLAASGRLVPFCPEVAGGLPVPRPACEIEAARAGLDGSAVLEGQARVVDLHGVDRTPQFVAGARAALALAGRLGIRRAILKCHSPSCGVGKVYDGRFAGLLVPGDGVTAALFRQAGIQVMAERDLGGLE